MPALAVMVTHDRNGLHAKQQSGGIRPRQESVEACAYGQKPFGPPAASAAGALVFGQSLCSVSFPKQERRPDG